MQVWPLRAAPVAAERDEHAFLHREDTGGNIQRHLPGLKLVLFSIDIGGQRGIELIEMRIQGGIAIGMPDINGLTKPQRLDHYPGHIAVGGGHHRQVLFLLGTNVQPHMVVTRPELAKIRRQLDGYVQGIAEVFLGIACPLERICRRADSASPRWETLSSGYERANSTKDNQYIFHSHKGPEKQASEKQNPFPGLSQVCPVGQRTCGSFWVPNQENLSKI